MSKPKRASLEEVLNFCNKVREVGGADLLDALMPADPKMARTCLIARNLNFDCAVRSSSNPEWRTSYDAPDHERIWVMVLQDKKTRDKIAKALNLETCDYTSFCGLYEIRLPQEIGMVARDFDKVGDYLLGYSSAVPSVELVQEMWPYFSETTRHNSRFHLTKDGIVTNPRFLFLS